MHQHGTPSPGPGPDPRHHAVPHGHHAPHQHPSGKKPRSAGRTLAWIGCGCATVFLLAVVGGGVGAAYAFGWFGPKDVYTAPPPDACELLDVEAASEIAGNGPHLEVYDSDFDYVFHAEGHECNVHPGVRAETGHPVRLRSFVFVSQASGVEMNNGTEKAMHYYESWDSLSPSSCPGGETVLSGPDGNFALAIFLRDNLVLESEVEVYHSAGEALDEQERVQTAEDLLCDAVGNL